jgi:RND family efflux transporter MFP subunit
MFRPAAIGRRDMASHRTIVRLAVVVALGVAVACGRSEATTQATRAASDPVRTLTLAQVQPRAMPKELLLTGTLVAHRQSDLAANATGRVLSTHVERGQSIPAGTVVARLDARMAKYSASAARAQSRVAKAQLDLAKTECSRADKLLADGVISKAEYDRTTSDCTTTLSSAAAADANAALAAVQAGDSVVKAPFAGIVGERFVEVGEYVQPSTRVASLYAIDPIRLSIAVPEADVGRIAQGQEVTFTVAALAGRSFDAKVKYVSPALREGTRDLVVEAVAENPDHVLRPGMFATVHVATGEEELPTVPASAIVRDEVRTRVWVVREGRATPHVVRLGPERDGQVAILSGVSADDAVVAEPPADLVDGTRVE